MEKRSAQRDWIATAASGEITPPSKKRAMGQNYIQGYSAFPSLLRKVHGCTAPSSLITRARTALLVLLDCITQHFPPVSFLMPQELLSPISPALHLSKPFLKARLSGEPSHGAHTRLAIPLPMRLTRELPRARPALKTLREHHKAYLHISLLCQAATCRQKAGGVWHPCRKNAAGLSAVPDKLS